MLLLASAATLFDPLERSARTHGALVQGCTLNITASELSNRRYGRLWLSQPHWRAWQKAGADRMRRLRSPSSFHGGETVIDIGSYVGVDLVAFLRHAPATIAVHTFEPVAAYRQLLQRRVQRFVASGRDRLTIHDFGLGETNHTACFAATKAASTDEVRGEACSSPARIVDAAVAIGGFARVDLLQINCEGCEYTVLERLLEVPSAFGAVRSVEVQFHLDWGAQTDTARYCRIEAGLRGAAFELDYRHPFLWERWSRRT